MPTTVTSKGQVTIPKRVRELLGIGPGSVIDFERGKDGRVVVVWSRGRPGRTGLPAFAAMPERV